MMIAWAGQDEDVRGFVYDRYCHNQTARVAEWGKITKRSIVYKEGDTITNRNYDTEALPEAITIPCHHLVPIEYKIVGQIHAIEFRRSDENGSATGHPQWVCVLKKKGVNSVPKHPSNGIFTGFRNDGFNAENYRNRLRVPSVAWMKNPVSKRQKAYNTD